MSITTLARVLPARSFTHHFTGLANSPSSCRISIFRRTAQNQVRHVILVTAPDPVTAAHVQPLFHVIASAIHARHLHLFPPVSLTWIFHQPNVVDSSRPLPHHDLEMAEMDHHRSFGMYQYLPGSFTPLNYDEFEALCGGLVEL